MKFRKKPVVVDAIQFDGTWKTAACFVSSFFDEKTSDAIFIPDLIEAHIACPNDTYIKYKDNKIILKTLEGGAIANKNDWIIRGVKGEFYPCKPDIFDQTYEKVIEDQEVDQERLDKLQKKCEEAKMERTQKESGLVSH